ncbi:piercer of microtubule wall 2 protein [Latimeria chalumnae]
MKSSVYPQNSVSVQQQILTKMCDAQQNQTYGNTETEKPLPKTSDFYRIDPTLPERFNHPHCFQGYTRKKQPHPLYTTSNQEYGKNAPTVHEMPTTFKGRSQKFSDFYGKCGMYRDNGFNTCTERSDVTGPDNLITFYDRLNFHHCYNVSGPSHSG